MLQIRELTEIKNTSKKVEELLNDHEKELLNKFGELAKAAAAEGSNFIIMREMTPALWHLLALNGYAIEQMHSDVYRVEWLYVEPKNGGTKTKQVISLKDGSVVEIDGTLVKHVDEKGNVLYDSASRILYNQDNIDDVKRKLSNNQNGGIV